ncbi:MAG: glycosyltransferase family 2 protein [Candidatus Heimdallarchaeota archaeon]|nr:glycosyltransferase family 2 protein [Candidatus Heimdallarchaeota archaeon]MBY8993989.1 glycosyltransferase family 2 protein [Candidatus Heimdallarchaeota archaeon]
MRNSIVDDILISIVIPVFNEEDNVVPLFNSIRDVLTNIQRDFEVIFVDDGSTDKTLSNLKSVLDNGVEKDTLRIIELQRNFGQTPALLAGLANIKGELVITMDGDLQNDPQDIPAMLEALTDEFDLICGWRKNRKDNALKKLPSKFNNLLNRKLNNVFIHDSGCTLRIYRREVIEHVQLFAEGHRYIPAILAQQGYRLGEVVTNHRPRTNGKTKYGFKRLFRGFIDLLTLNAINKWGEKPIHLFSRWSLLFMLVSFLTFCWTILERVAFRFWDFYSELVSIRSNPLFILSFSLFLFGILLLFIGFIAELLLRSSYNSKESYKIKKEWS